ncbi:hypothetical protein KBY96_01130 [Cyanobium sp. ATX 6A2]|uniref:hypothetical protein n=1 Tax=Cyanobium sp. ATX 6A2 TaxID=2823700 RepID=UPI0020CBDCEF|nr:hypothetical protein [Cyanobium sp. ATX 6A2]MCP9886545.1 hypothetical protein [Cyanobium sp. ATX 6A2]
MNLSSLTSDTTFSVAPSASASTASAPTASDRVLAAELAARTESHDALSMMVSSMVRMVQAGRTRDSRWKDS